MKIVQLVESHTEKMGYSDVCLPKALSSLGHDMYVVTTTGNSYFNTPEYNDVFKDITDKKDVGTFKLSGDASGKSNATTVNFFFKNDSLISVQCKDWSKEMEYWDRLKVTLVSKEYYEFTQRAYD